MNKTSLSIYHGKKPTIFILEPSEPAICLRMSYGEGTMMGFAGELQLRAAHIPKDHMFWMGSRSLEFTLQPGDHFHLNLLIRPECLSHLLDRS